MKVVILDSILYDPKNDLLHLNIQQLQKEYNCDIYFDNLAENIEKENDLLSIINLSTALINLLAAILLISSKSNKTDNWSIETLNSIVGEKMLEEGTPSYEIVKIVNLSEFKANKCKYFKVLVKTEDKLHNLYIFNKERILVVSPKEINHNRF